MVRVAAIVGGVLNGVSSLVFSFFLFFTRFFRAFVSQFFDRVSSSKLPFRTFLFGLRTIRPFQDAAGFTV